MLDEKKLIEQMGPVRIDAWAEDKEDREKTNKKTEKMLSLKYNDVDLLKCSDKEFMEVFENEPIQLIRQCSNKYIKFNSNHNQWMGLFANCKKMLTILAHRGSFKTTTARIFLLFEMIKHPERSYLYIQNTDDKAYKAMQFMERISSYKIVKRLVKILHNIDNFKVNAHRGGLETNLGIISDTSLYNIDCNGLNNSLTGDHYDVIITDDIVVSKDRWEQGKRDRTVYNYKELANSILNEDMIEGERPTKIINIGTPWHPEDAIALEMDRPDIGRLCLKWDVFNMGLMTDKEIIAKKIAINNDPLFSINYLLKYDDEQRDYPFRDIHFVDRDLKPEDYFGCIMHIDISFKKDGGDLTALTIAKDNEENGEIYVQGMLFNSIYDPMFNATLCDIYEKMGATVLYAEGKNNALENVLTNIADKIKEQFDVEINVKTYHENSSKTDKINALQYNWNDIFFDKDTNAEYLKQIRGWSSAYKTKHDDAPDSLASAIIALGRSGKLRVLKERLF